MCRLTAAVQIHAVQGTTVNLLNGLLLTWINQSEKYVVYDYCLNSNFYYEMGRKFR